MQVDPKPSPWPCAVMLIGLLVFCLTVPHYWQDSTDRSLAIGESGTPSAVAEALRDWSTRPVRDSLSAYGQGMLGMPAGTMPNAGLLTLLPTPTIEELVESARLGSAQFSGQSGSEGSLGVGWPVMVSPMIASGAPWQSVDSNSEAADESSPLLAAAMERVGRVIAVYSIAESLPRLVSRAIEWYQACVPERTASLPPSPSASTWRLVSPDEQIALRIPDTNSETLPAMPLVEPSPKLNAAADSDPWCVPQALYEQLERLARHPYSAQWANSTIAQLRAITECDRPGGGDLPRLLSILSRSAEKAATMADETGEDRLRVELLRAHWALARRIDTWTVMHDIRVAERTGIRIASRGSLRTLFQDAHGQRAGHANEAALTSELETYETSRDPQLARRVAEQRQALESSSDGLDQTLADAVEQHYRNANVRVPITATLLNRLIGQQRTEMRPVCDRIAGTPVRGESLTVSESRVRLEPASGRWHLDVKAQGVVESDTLANGGRARVRSFGATDFTAQKTVMVDPDGVRMESTVVDTRNYGRLAGVTTDFDWVPLFGSYARSRAVHEYRAKRPRAKAEVEYKVAAQASDAMDRETVAAVQRVQQEVRERLTGPIANSGVELTPIELTTTHERIVARLRVAGDHQLGAHTPRPRALSDSLASLQVHESALTNAAVSLWLDGARYSAAELQTMLREKLPRMAAENPPEARDDTVFEFAYRDAVQFRIGEGRLELMLSLSNFEYQGRSTRDFIVHAFYVPVVDGLSAELVRDGPLGIEGRLSATERARLQNAFKRVLSEDRRLPIVRVHQASDPRLEGLMITQMVLEDGWIGVAVGPGGANRVAERSRSLR